LDDLLLLFPHELLDELLDEELELEELDELLLLEEDEEDDEELELDELEDELDLSASLSASKVAPICVRTSSTSFLVSTGRKASEPTCKRRFSLRKPSSWSSISAVISFETARTLLFASIPARASV